MGSRPASERWSDSEVNDRDATAAAAFDWLRRMGVHEAYHLHATNRLLHWVCIPLQLLMFIKLLSLVSIGPVDLAMIGIAAAGIIYVAADRFAGALMVVILVGLWALAGPLTTGSPWLDAAAATSLFAASFVVQTRVGHGVFERGIDDTAMNLTELKWTKNPIPLVLIFYYHLVEIMFAAGYRPALRAEMLRHRDAALAVIPNDPRPR